MFRAIASVMILLSSTLVLHAQDKCTRTMLQAATDSYIAAQKAGDISKMALASTVKYFENMSETTKEKGLWNTALPISLHRSIYDVGRCKTFTEVIVTEGGYPYVIGTRLAVKNGSITEIDSLVTDADDWLFNAENFQVFVRWPGAFASDSRVTRQDLIDAGNYLDFVFMDKGTVPWGTLRTARGGNVYE